MLGFTEVVVRKLLGYKEENNEEDGDDGERVNAFITGVDYTSKANERKPRASMAQNQNSFENIIAKE